MNISIEQVQHVAALARLKLTDQEQHLFAGQMGAILGYAETLNSIDTTGVVPTSHAVPVENVFREDVVTPPLGVDKALNNSPDRAGSFYRVPKVIE